MNQDQDQDQDQDQGQDKKVPLIELFGPTIQGEGELAGQVSYFIRTGGCDYRCFWCDSMFAVDQDEVHRNAEWLTPNEILQKFRDHTKTAPIHGWVTISGGNPAIWNLTDLVGGLRIDDLKVAVETQGSIAAGWLDLVNLITCSPKGPSSGMVDKLDLNVLYEYYGRWRRKLIFKIVIFTKKDLNFAESLHAKFPDIPLYLSAGTPLPASGRETKEEAQQKVLLSYRYLATEFLKRPRLHDARVLPQLHVLLWGHAKGV
jgi:7-carboxy-7-deazaguanine synthase